MLKIVLAAVCCRFGSRGWVTKLNFCSDFQHKVRSGVWSWSSGDILKLMFGQYFAANVWLRLRSWILVKIMKLGLVKILCLSLVKMLMFGWDFKVFYQDFVEVWSRFVEILMFAWDFYVNAKSRFWNWNMIKICVRTCVIWTQPSGPLCLVVNDTLVF